MPVAEFAGLLATFVIAGSSLTGTSMTALMGDGYSVTCGLTIENWTKWPLTNPYVIPGGGYVSTPPVPVLPGKKEAFVTRKTGKRIKLTNYAFLQKGGHECSLDCQNIDTGK